MDDLKLLTDHMFLNARPAPGVENGTEFHVGEVNFFDSGRNWSEINCILTPLLTGFEMADAPFYFKAPKRSTGYAVIIANNRFDVSSKVEITASELEQVIRCVGAYTVGGGFYPINDVIGEQYDINENGRYDAVIYRNAFTSPFLGDLIYFVEHGRSTRLKKLIRFNTAPENDITLEFEIEYSGRVELTPNFLRTEEIRIQEREKWAATLSEGEYLYLNSNNGLCVQAWGESQKRFMSIKKPLIWDSGKDIWENPAKMQVIESYIEEISGNKIKLIKFVPKSFFTGAVLPVITDSTFYPDAGTGGNSVDGLVFRVNKVTWTDARDPADGDGALPSVTQSQLIAELNGVQYACTRLFALFNISSVPDDHVASAGTVSFFDTNNFTTRAAFGLVQANPASDNDLVVGDFDAMTIDSPDEGATRISSFGSPPQYHTMTLNATALSSWLDFTGLAKFCVRMAKDIDNTTPTGPRELIEFRFADHPGLTQDPILVLTTAPGVSGIAPLRRRIEGY